MAVAGGELGIQTALGTQTHYTTDEGEFVCSFGDIEREAGETWDDFVERSCEEVSLLLLEFRPVRKIIGPCTIGFMLMWKSREE